MSNKMSKFGLVLEPVPMTWLRVELGLDHYKLECQVQSEGQLNG